MHGDLICTSTLKGIKPSVSFSSLQEIKMHGLEVGEGGGICEERSDTEYEGALQKAVKYSLQANNPVQTVQSLT